LQQFGYHGWKSQSQLFEARVELDIPEDTNGTKPIETKLSVEPLTPTSLGIQFFVQVA